MSDLQSPVSELLNRREIEILRLIKIGLSNQDIAQKLNLSVETVKWYNRQIFSKMSVGSRTQACEKAIEIGLIETWAGVRDPAREMPVPETRPRHNLRASVTTFIGRKKEIPALKQLILTRDCRLVTVTGVGGVGKTRLALHVGWKLLKYFSDGIYFVSLAAINESHLVIPAIAATFNLYETPRQSLEELLKEYLFKKRMLLILDNFEQVLDAGPQICDLLASAPHLKILTTSREILHLAGEQVFTLLPLPLPVEQLSPEDILKTDPVQLFVQRARAIWLNFNLSEENILALLEICRKLDGLPLGIELAAARVRIFNPVTILTQLDNRLQILVGGGRDMPPRQRSLRASIEWSYHLLTPFEQTLFKRLAVFSGGCTLEAIEAMCAESGPVVMRGIESLLDKQLLLCTDLKGEPRFGMFETIREFSLECLEQSCEHLEIRRRYSEYYAGFLENFFYELNRLETEIENFRAVLRWAIESSQAEPGFRIINHAWFWSQRNREWHYWLDNLLSSSEAQTASQLRLHVIFHAFLQAFFQRDYLRCKNMLDEHLAQEKMLGDKIERVASLYLSGHFHILNEEHAEAVDALREGLALSEQLGTTEWVAYSNWGLGDCLLLLQDFNGAEAVLQSALCIFTNLGCRFQRIEILTSLGTVSLEKNEFRHAAELFKQSLEEAIRFGFKTGFADCLNGLAAISLKNGDHHRSACLYGAVFGMGKMTGSLSHDPPLMVISQRYQAALSQQMDPADLDRAWQEGQMMTIEEALEYGLEIVTYWS